ncbi:CheR family methyltransferase [Grimontia marina]|uniref:Chemotaxis protein methyltransferase n=1 Tax=Grimontia marina TaxID=646534 RepID=A0A128F1A8_9GAMM|nr:protein-glutamate O-methyltransferase CheR [Grimontia marina]CZF80583.1 Chemotaxis protein methyltransferase [Grimontia marina]
MVQKVDRLFTSQADAAAEGRENFDTSMVRLSSVEFRHFTHLIYHHAGIRISSDKRTMLESRLKKRLYALKIHSFKQYADYLKSDMSGRELTEFTNAITTNKTEFFRGACHFELMRKDIIDQHRSDTIFIWSAACASGEEPYSIAMVCDELQHDNPGFEAKILATDIDTQRLAICESARYEKERLSEIPIQFRHRYTKFSDDPQDDTFHVADILRQQIKFRQYNLVHFSDKFGIQFHYIFLRNVLFYFPPSTAEKVVRSMLSQLQHGGMIFVGLTETLNNLDLGLEQVGTSVYRKVTHRGKSDG